MLLADIARRIGIKTDVGDVEILAVNSLDYAEEGDISFLADMAYVSKLSKTRASAILVPADFVYADTKAVLLPVSDIDEAVEKLLLMFAPVLPEPKVLRHPSSVISPEATLGEGVVVGPCSVIESGVVIGDNTKISAGCYIGHQVRIGSNCILWPNVVVSHCCVLGSNVVIYSNSSIGSDGFGYRTVKGEHRLIPHIGNVVIEDKVEIGSNCCVDRAKIGSTVVGAGTKVDNLVQIAHNVKIGPGSILVAQSGIGGSTVIGKYVVIAGQAALADHCEVKDFAQLGPRTGVMKGQVVPSGAKVMGVPFQDIKDVMRQMAVMKKLPEMSRELKKLVRDGRSSD